MSRYIDADALIVRLENSPIFLNFGEDGLFIREFVIRCIQDRTTADVAEVRHGEWQRWKNHPTIYGKDTLYVCSECTAKFLIESRYCAHCGAKMDGERRTEE